jgi:hypothetical protein
MKVQVKNIPVRYNGKTHQPGETFDMAEKYYNENLVSKVKDSKKQDKDD